MLHVHRSEHPDALVAGLGAMLRVPPADPFAPDLVAVPTRGVERWLRQRLSHWLGTTSRPDAEVGVDQAAGDGVCAHVLFPHPGELVADVLAASDGRLPQEDPWARDRMAWTLLEVIDEHADAPWCAPLGDHLGVGPGVSREEAHERRGRRMATARQLAARYDTYAANRPAMLQEWVTGADTDGAGAALPADLCWQAELWRQLRHRIGTPSPAERLPQATAWVRADPDGVSLPERVSVFGPTRLTVTQLDVLAALAAHRAVHLWLPHPSPVLWDQVATHLSASPGAPTAGLVVREDVVREDSSAPAQTPAQAAAGTLVRPRRRADPTATLAHHPLLASLGRDSRELQVQLAAVTASAAAETPPDPQLVVVHTHHPPPGRPDTLLGRLQQAISADQPVDSPTGLGSVGPAAADGSLQVHACHGPARQVEVLREVLVGLLADDPTLEPRDVLVMCPDVETYAPLISAAFGLGGPEPHPGHRLRVRLADRSVRQTNPVLGTLATLLELVPGRLTAQEVLDFAATGPVRRRFHFSDDELERAAEWVSLSGVRWGLDPGHRARFGLDRIAANTWRAGLDRLLLGVAMSEDGLHYLGQALPLDDVDSGDIDLAGRLAELLDRLARLVHRLSGEHPLDHWLATLTDALDELTALTDADQWAARQARQVLAELAETAQLPDAPDVPSNGAQPSGPLLSLPDIRALLAEPLAGHPTRANFRTGHLTVASMHPMRSVPHRVICLLGLDDGAYPRATRRDGEDILARDPLVGEWDPRSEDRQLLLDAILAAGEKLVILYTGADPRTNTPRPPAVPVGELLDTLGPPDGVVVHHPLQPFDADNFTPGRLTHGRAFSFDRQAYAGACQAAGPRRERPAFLDRPLDRLSETDVTLDDLIAFLAHPVKAFLSQRLGVALPGEQAELADAMAAELTGLDRWQVGDRMLRARLAGADPDACQQAEWRRGTLPPGRLGRQALDDVVGEVEQLVAASAPWRTVPPDTLDVTGAEGSMPGMVTGSVPGVYGDVIVRVEYSRLSPGHRLQAWAQLLALTVARPDTAWTAVTLGRNPAGNSGRGGQGRRGGQLARSTLGPVDSQTARIQLGALVDLRARGLCAPLPMGVRTSACYVEHRVSRRQQVPAAQDAAAREWESSNQQQGAAPGEQDDPAHRLVWGERAPLQALLDAAPADDERWHSDEPTRFGQLARRLWDPLLAAEQLDRW